MMNDSESSAQPMLSFFLITFAVVAVLFSGFSVYAVSAQQADANYSPQVKQSPVAFQNTMRQLWDEQVLWTRMYLISTSAGLQDQDISRKQVLQVQMELGNTLKPYYGSAAGDQLTRYLNEQFQITTRVVSALRSGDTAQLAIEKQKWYQNADEIASLLSGLNPREWSRSSMKAQLKRHVDLTWNELMDRVKGNYVQDASDFEKLDDHILPMADILSSGIMEQFPNVFAR